MEEIFLKIKNKAQAGSLESSDIFITVEPYDFGIDIKIESVVKNKFGKRIKKVIEETLKELSVENIKVEINDKGALDCTIKARLETAILRACQKGGID